MNDDDQLQVLGLALKLQSQAICEYLAFERIFFDGTWTREGLEKSARERSVFYDDNTSDYQLFAGVLSSMRVDLLNIAGQISDKIQIKDSE